jgi:hypothetical protein
MLRYGKYQILMCAFFCAVIFIYPACGATNVPDIDSLPFFYQRTLYLENLYQQGAWWANPATISPNRTTFFTSNTGLLGGKYVLSSVRLLFPVNSRLNGGVGITGTGTAEGRSFNGSASSAQVNSNFSFKRPSLEAGISYAPPVAGTIGGLMIMGTESIPRTTDTGNITYFFFGISAGWLSPFIFNTVKLSFSTFSVCHVQFIRWWDNSAKAGILIDVNESFVRGSVEYGFSLSGPVSFFRNQEDFLGYEVLKGDFSLRIRKIAGFLLGFSMDTKNFRDNGTTVHTGIELRRSDVYPFYGGYEIGMNLFATRFNSGSPHLSLLHRVWIGYDLKKQIKH